MREDIFIWDKTKLHKIRLSLIRNFSIEQITYGFNVVAWFSDTESLTIAEFSTKIGAEGFIDNLTNYQVSKEHFVWDIHRANQVPLELIKNLTIEEVGIETSIKRAKGYAIIAWLDNGISFRLEEFVTNEEAESFVKKLRS